MTVLFPAIITNQRWPYYSATVGVPLAVTCPRRDPNGEGEPELT